MKLHIWTLLLIVTVIAMLLQLSWQIPEVWQEPVALIAGALLLALGTIGGNLMSHSDSTKRAIRILAFFFFVILGIQWANSFRDDYLIWSFRWMCLGLLIGSFLPQIWTFPTHQLPISESADSDEGPDDS